MKHIALLLISALALLGSCKVETQKDLGPETTRTITVRNFNKLAISVCSDYEYIPSDTFSVTITAPEKALDRILLNVTSDSTLSIEKGSERDKDNVMWIMRNSGADAVKIIVRAPYLTSVNIAGSSTFTCNKTMRAPQLALAIAGSGEICVAGVEADRVKTQIAGSGDIQTSLSQTTSTIAHVTGSGTITLGLKRCGDVGADVTGSGTITLSGDAETIAPTITGSGVIDTDNLKLTK